MLEATVKLTIYPALIAALFSFAVISHADDSPSAPPVKSPKQKMHDCIVKERADNSSMSKEDVKKACEVKIQSDNNHPSRPQPSPNPTPN